MMLPDLPLIDVFGRGGALKSSWYGDCLPSRDFPMLVDLYQQGRLDLDAFVSEEIGPRRRRGRVRRRCTTATCCARWWCSRDRAAVDHAVTAGTFSLDGETFDVDNNVWVVGDDDECVVIDAPHDVDGDPRGGRRPHGSRRSCARTPTTTTSGSRPALRRAGDARRSCCTPTTGRCGS